MKKSLLSLLIILLVASFVSVQNWLQGTLEDALVKAKAENKLVLVDFTSYA